MLVNQAPQAPVALPTLAVARPGAGSSTASNPPRRDLDLSNETPLTLRITHSTSRPILFQMVTKHI